MIKIAALRVKPIKVDRLLISWEFEQTLENFQEYSFELQRSQSPESDFETVHRFTDSVQFVDELQYKRLWTTLFYRIKTTQLSTGAVAITGPEGIGSAPNLEALEIIRRNDILLKNRRHGIGVPIIVFLKKRSGITCECWDADKKRPRTSNCLECFGGTFYGGYHDPIITWANLTPDTKMVQIPQWGEMEANESRIFMSNYPVLTPKDVVIDPHKMILWTVERIETSERRGCLLHQIVSISYIDKNHVLYTLLDKYPDLMSEIQSQSDKIQTR